MRDGWREVLLHDVASESRDRVPVEMGIAYAALGVTRDGKGLFARDAFIGGETGYRVLTPVRPGQVVLRSITAWEAPVGVARGEHIGHFVSAVFPVFDLDARFVLSEFMALQCQSPEFWEEMRIRSTGTVMRRKTLPAKRFLSIPMRLPPLSEQRRIVDLVRAIDGATRGDALASKSDASWRAILDDVAGEADNWSELSSVVIAARAGGTPSRRASGLFGGSTPWLKSGEVDSAHIRRTAESVTELGLRSSSAWVMPRGTIVVAMYGQGGTAGNVGYLEEPMSSNQAVLGLVPNPELVHPRFLFHWLRSRKESMRSRRSGSTQPNLSKELVLGERVPALNWQRQREVAKALDGLLDMSEAARHADAAMILLRGSILADLLSGEHEIPASYDRFLDATA